MSACCTIHCWSSSNSNKQCPACLKDQSEITSLRERDSLAAELADDLTIGSKVYEVTGKQKNSFYPELSEDGRKAAQDLLDGFKLNLKKAALEVIDNLYMDVAVHIEGDSWTNYRNKIMDGFRNYGNKIHHEHDFKSIREEIFKEFRTEIIKDLDQDNLKEIERLKSALEHSRSTWR